MWIERYFEKILDRFIQEDFSGQSGVCQLSNKGWGDIVNPKTWIKKIKKNDIKLFLKVFPMCHIFQNIALLEFGTSNYVW